MLMGMFMAISDAWVHPSLFLPFLLQVARSLEKGLGDFSTLKVHVGNFIFLCWFGSQLKVALVVLGEDIFITLLRGHEGSLKHYS